MSLTSASLHLLNISRDVIPPLPWAVFSYAQQPFQWRIFLLISDKSLLSCNLRPLSLVLPPFPWKKKFNIKKPHPTHNVHALCVGDIMKLKIHQISNFQFGKHIPKYSQAHQIILFLFIAGEKKKSDWTDFVKVMFIFNKWYSLVLWSSYSVLYFYPHMCMRPKSDNGSPCFSTVKISQYSVNKWNLNFTVLTCIIRSSTEFS